MSLANQRSYVLSVHTPEYFGLEVWMHKVFFSLRIVLCGLILLFLSTSAAAQFKAGIQGTVTDTAGGLIPAAKITLTNTETGKAQETTASDEGFYRVSGLAPAKYKLA